MSDVDGTCEYVLDPDNPETWGGEEGDECYVDNVWRCPYEDVDDNKCPFHRDPGDGSTEPHILTDAIHREITKANNEERGKAVFIGAKLGTLEVSWDGLIEEYECSIDFRHASFEKADF